MEEITMERLLNDFKSVIEDFNNLVANKDIEGVKKALSEVENLLNTATEVELDSLEDVDSDHILHHLLRNLSGYIEKENIIPGTSDRVIIIEEERERYERLEIEERELIARIAELRKSNQDREDNQNENSNQDINDDLVQIPTGDREILFQDYLETSNPDIEMDRIAREQNIDRDELEMVWGSADGLQSDDGPVSPYQIIRRKIEQKTVQEIDEEIAILEAQATRNSAEMNEYNTTLEFSESLKDEDKADLRRAIAELQAKNEEINKRIRTLREAKEKATHKANEKTKEENEQSKTENPNEKLIAELEERLSKIRIEKLEIEKHSKEIYIEGEDEHSQKETFDVQEAVNKIGENIFKTAKIRRELANRDISREEFIEFYNAGKKVAIDNMKELNNHIDEIEQFIQSIFLDEETGESLYDQYLDSREKNDEQRNISISETLRQRCLKTGKFSDEILQKEIKTKEDADAFDKYIQLFIKSANDQIRKIGIQVREQQEDISIFDAEIQKIEKEQKAVEQYGVDGEGILHEAEAEKELRARQIRATMYGDPALEKEWSERFDRFYKNKETKEYTYLDENSNEKTITYETIKDYPELEEDAYFLNLTKYKEYLEMVTKYRASNGDINALGPDAIARAQVMLNQGQPWEKVKEAFDKEIAGYEKYVNTFHGHANEHKVKYDNYRTAGSTLNSMIPIKNLPPAEKAKAVTSNVFRFFGIRTPQFKRIDNHGNEVKDVKGGILTLAMDAAIIGGIGLTAGLAGAPGVAAIGIGYAAKGVVTIGNKVAGSINKSQNESEIESNKPTLFIDSKDSREVARKQYYIDEYKENTGKEHKIRAWFKAKSDKYFTRKRAEDTEKKIVEKRIAQSDQEIDIKSAEAYLEFSDIKENQQIRQENFRKVTRSAKTYNDIVKDPNSVDLEQTASVIAQNAALGMYGRTQRNVNPNSQKTNTNQYVKPEEDLEYTYEVSDVIHERGSVANTAITEEQHYTGRQQKQDRINRVATIILSTVGNIGLNAFLDKLKADYQLPDTQKQIEVDKYEEVTSYDDVTTYDETTKYDEITSIDDITTYDYITTGGNSTPPGVQKVLSSSDKLSDYTVGTDGLHNTYRGDVLSVPNDIISTGNANTVSDTTAISIQYFDSQNKEIVSSIAESTSNYMVGRNVHAITNIDLSSLTPAEVVEQFKNLDPSNFNKIVSDLGLNNPTNKDIWNELVKRGCVSLEGRARQGWQRIDASNVQESLLPTGGYYTPPVTQKIPTGNYQVQTGIDKVPTEIDKVLTGNYQTTPTTKRVFTGTTTQTITIPGGTVRRISPKLVVEAGIHGAIPGAAIAATETLHEAIHQTKKVRPGTYEEAEPHSYFDKILKMGQSKIKENLKRKNANEKAKRTDSEERV